MWSRANDGPVLFLSILGKDASDLLSVCHTFKYSKALTKAAESTFIFHMDNPKFLDDSRLFPNQTWKFRFGVYNDMSPVITAVIREVEPLYADKREATIKLFDSSMSLAASSQGKNWGKVTSSSIAKKLAAKINMKCKVDDSQDVPKKDWVQPGDINDLQYLRDLAAMIDFEVFVDGETLIYRKKPYGAAPVKTITYYYDVTDTSFVKSCKPKIKGLGPLKSGVASTDDKKGKGTSSSTASGDKANMALSGYAVEVEGEGGNSEVVEVDASAGKGVTKPAPAGANTAGMAHANRQQMLDACNEMTSEHIFTPSIWPGSSYTWAGLDPQLNGKWYAEKLECSVTGTALSTSIDWKRNARNKGSNSDKNKNANNKGADGKGAPVVEVEGENGESGVF